MSIKIGTRQVGPGHPCYVIAEAGINHNGDVGTFLQLARVAADAGCDAIKGQVRTPEWCVPQDQWDIQRETPWGVMSYIEYRRRMEFDTEQWAEITSKCKRIGIALFSSCWDAQSVRRTGRHHWAAHKVASAMVTNLPLLRAMRETGKPIILSTGMSTLDEVDAAVAELGTDNLAIMQSTSAYPCENDAINLHVMDAFRSRYPGVPIGYSGHERGLAPTLAAVAMGADLVERHITLDRTMWGTDQSASLEPKGLYMLLRDIRAIEQAKGTADKRVLACELAAKRKLRG